MSHSKGKRLKLTVRMPRILHERLKALAAKEGLDLNTWMERHLERESAKP